MPTPLKFDQEKRSLFRFERSDYRAHYEDLAARVLPSIVRHGRLIASFVAFALAAACIIIPLLPRKYSAEALIYPNLLSREQEKVVTLASVDAAAIVNGEARLIRSDAILREVARRLGEDPNTLKSRSWLMVPPNWFRAVWLPETRNHSPFDRAVAMLRNKVVIMNDTRSYMISISFTASSPEEAVQVVNAIVSEYLRDKVKQRRLSKLVSAEAELQQLLTLYGERHPKTLQIVAELDAGRASLEAAMDARNGDPYEIAYDQSVKLAVPNHTPTSPKGLMIIGLSLLSALLAGVGLAVWRDRRQMEVKQTVDYQPRRRRSEVKQPVVKQHVDRQPDLPKSELRYPVIYPPQSQ